MDDRGRSAAMTKTIEERERVVIRFAGDSGDGMQLVGTQFTNTSAVFGNDVVTLPDFPAEIRAPAGTLADPGSRARFPRGGAAVPGHHRAWIGRSVATGRSGRDCSGRHRGAAVAIRLA